MAVQVLNKEVIMLSKIKSILHHIIAWTIMIPILLFSYLLMIFILTFPIIVLALIIFAMT